MPETNLPKWFIDSIALPRTDHTLQVAGATIHYQRWRSNNKPGLLFVHGYGAHCHWWDFIAPEFIDNYDVVAMDMSGAGESDHRDKYDALTFATEIISVIKDAKLQSPTIVGHSFGGTMTRIAAFLHGSDLQSVIIVDSMVSRQRGARDTPAKPNARIRYYPSITEAARRFRLRPPQACNNKYLIDYIARHSFAQAAEGYYFKLDQSLFARMVEPAGVVLPDAATMIEQIPCPIGFIYGQHSRFFRAEAVQLLSEIIQPEWLCEIADAHHHVFLDQPLAFIDTLKTLLKKISG